MGLIAQNTKSKNNKIKCLYPSYVDTTNPKFMLVDNMYVSSILVSNYENEMEGGFLDKLLALGIDMQIAMYYEKLDKFDVLKKITYQIGVNGADMKSSSDNQIDINTMNKRYSDAKYIREKLQIDGEELYNLSIYIVVYASSVKKMEESIKRVENLLYAIGLTGVRALFKQEEVFMTGLPLLKQDEMLRKITKRNVLTSGLSSTYPFVSNDICDEDGVFVGLNESNNSIVMINRFDTEKYKNANMFVLGTSGSGKSYFTKLMIIRNRYFGILQYIVDPDREYYKLCKKLNGTLIDFKNITINVLDIRISSKDETGSFLENKIRKLKGFFEMIFEDISKEEESIFEEKLIETYNIKGITFDDNSLYNAKGCFKEREEMPKLQDLYNVLKKDNKVKRLALMLKPYVSGSMKFINEYTNADLLNKIVVSDIYDIEEKDLPIVLYIITEFYWDKIKEDRGEKKILYMDEAWRLINKNAETAEFVFKVFKTIRKYGGAATVVTQDVNDFFSLEEGRFGKSILNNSSIKCIFQLEENEKNGLKKIVELSESEENKIGLLKRGECIMHAGREQIVLKVEASKLEHDFITTDPKDIKVVVGGDALATSGK